MATSIALLSAAIGFAALCSAQIELDERLLKYRNDAMWLVEFYAPWCGHCKKLEPIFKEVARELEIMESPLRVGKVDCTRYSNIASEFQVRGFPTIMFIHGDRTFTHKGDRSKEDILQFALRAQGPTVRRLSSIGKLNEARSQHSDNVFFLYIGEDDQFSDYFKKYQEVAEAQAVYSYFYIGRRHILDNIKIENHPTLLVFKDGTHYEFKPESSGMVTASALQKWITRERYINLPMVTGAGLNEMVSASKYLVILALDKDQLKDPNTASSRLFAVVKFTAFSHRATLHSEFQFLWMPEMETVSSISMSFLASPALLVLETDDQLYFMPDQVTNLTVTELVKFLKSVSEGQEPAYGGTGFFMRIKRIFYDLISTVVSIWQASRWLFLLMFGLPTIIISIICYSLCCMEAIDDVEEEDEEEYEDEQPPPLPPSEGEKPSYDELCAGDAEPKQKTGEEKKNE